MIIEPKIRNNICLTAHPTGCALQVRDMIRFTKQRKKLRGPRAALIIGASNGYGMGARVAAAYGCGAATLGIAFERPSTETKIGTAGYYNDRGLPGLRRRGRDPRLEPERGRLRRRDEAGSPGPDPPAPGSRWTWWSTASLPPAPGPGHRRRCTPR